MPLNEESMKFYLKDANLTNSYIFMDINYAHARIRLSTGYQIKSISWDDTNQKVKRNENNYIVINNYLTSIKSKIDDFIANKKLHRIKLSKHELKSAVLYILNPESVSINNKFDDFFETFKKWILKRESSGIYSEKRIEKYLDIFRNLKKFADFSNIEIKFSKIDKTFIENFVSFLINERNHVNNTINNELKVLKTFLNDIKDEIGDGLSNQYKSFKPFKEAEAPTVALNEDEFLSLQNLDLQSHALRIARDLFVLQVYTLLRRSDLMQIKPEHINLSKRTLTLNQLKTHDKITIPIPENCMQILSKWNYIIPNLHYTKYNEYIQEICKLADIKDDIQIVRYSGSMRLEETKPKYELITSHTARRTGITLLIKKGVPLNMIMKISGHKNVETLMKYERLTKEEAVEYIRNVW